MALTKVTYSMIDSAPFNVQDYGAVGDGVVDDTAAIQAAITAAIASNSPDVYIPAGSYKLTNQIDVTGLVNIYGDGWKPDSGISPAAGSGTVLICTFPATTASNLFYVTGAGVSFRNLEILCNYQPSATDPSWAPITTPNAIQFYRAPYATNGAADPVVDNVLIVAMTTGVFINGANRGSIDVYGYTFGPLLHVDGSFDVLKVKNVHYWPFGGTGISLSSGDWTLQNVYAVHFGRCDNPVIDNIFAYNVKSGIYFGVSARAEAGSVQNACFSNVGVDVSYYGVLVETNVVQVSAEFQNIYVNCNATAGTSLIPSRGFYVKSSTYAHSFNIANSQFYYCGGEAIRIEANSSNVQISNLRVGDLYHYGYNQENNNYAAVYADNNVLISISQYDIISTNAHGAPFFNSTSGSGGIVVPSNPVVGAGSTSLGLNGLEIYTAIIDDNPVTVYRFFGRTAISISGAGSKTWSAPINGSIPTKVLSARVSSASTLNVSNLAIFSDQDLPITGPITTVTGSFDTSATSGTLKIDWEIFGY